MIYSCVPYQGIVKDFLSYIKFESYKTLLGPLSFKLESWMNDSSFSTNFATVDEFCFVPLHQQRFEKRGFNQVEGVFRDAITLLDKPINTAVKRSKNTIALYQLNMDERKETLSGAFVYDSTESCHGKTICICDDILTTGATLTEIASLFRERGAKSVIGLTLAYGE